MNLQIISNTLKKLKIKMPEIFIKEEFVRYVSEIQGERIVEIPIIFKNIPEKKSKILDVGCRYSLIPIQLASLGHQVYGIDIKKYRRTHPNLTFLLSDIMESGYENNFFDVVLSVSTIEHIGLTAYGDPEVQDGDIKAVEEIYRILRKDGRFLLTIPFGKPKKSSWYRVYNTESTKKLLQKFHINKMQVFRRLENNKWAPCTVEFGDKIESGKEIYSGVAFLEAIKS